MRQQQLQCNLSTRMVRFSTPVPRPSARLPQQGEKTQQSFSPAAHQRDRVQLAGTGGSWQFLRVLEPKPQNDPFFWLPKAADHGILSALRVGRVSRWHAVPGDASSAILAGHGPCRPDAFHPHWLGEEQACGRVGGLQGIGRGKERGDCEPVPLFRHVR